MAVSVYDRGPAPSINALKTTKQKDLWLLVVVIASSLASIAATVYYYINGDILLYNDSYTHLLKARSVIDSLTPGFEQIGDVWLPLQHILMLPFIWNDYLWRTGLAGTIPSIVSYVIAASYLFCTLRRLTKQIATSLIGVIIFLCNPNILYLQSTPLTEVMCTAAFAATAYYLLCWLQSESPQYITSTAIATCVATLIRYDGWALFLVVGVLVIAAAFLRKRNRDMTVEQFMIYLSIAPIGIIFWLIWNAKLSGDPLYFYRGPYSAQAYQLYFLHKGELPTYHNLLVSFRTYVVDVGQTIGWGFFVCACLSLVVLLLAYRKRQEYGLIAVMLIPFVFYVASLYTGSSIIELPGAGNTTFFNVRYGAQMALPAAFLIARGSALIYSWFHRWYLRIVFALICLLSTGAQVVSINAFGILSLQDGLTGISCNNPAEPVIISLSQHYTGGRILVDEHTSIINPQLFGADFSAIVYEGSGTYWKNALTHPSKFVDWIVLNPNNHNDTVSQLLTGNGREFLRLFRLVSSNPNGLQLYYRRGAPAFPTRPISNDLLNRPHTCKFNE